MRTNRPRFQDVDIHPCATMKRYCHLDVILGKKKSHALWVTPSHMGSTLFSSFPPKFNLDVTPSKPPFEPPSSLPKIHPTDANGAVI